METTNNVIQFPSVSNEDEPLSIADDLDKAFDSFLVHMADLGYEDVLTTQEACNRLGYILELLRITFLSGRGHEHEWENHLNLILGVLKDAGAIIQEDDNDTD